MDMIASLSIRLAGNAATIDDGYSALEGGNAGNHIMNAAPGMTGIGVNTSGE